MPLGNLFKSKAKESSELRLFTEKRKIENQIAILKRKKAEIQKKAASATSKDEDALVAEFSRVNTDLKRYEGALAQVKHVETGLRGSSSGTESLDDILAKILVDLDKLSDPGKTGGVSEKAKLKAEMNIQRRLATTPAGSGMETLNRLSDSVFLDETDDSDARAEARAELFGGSVSSKDRILARMAEIEEDINS
ncbi:MAG: hypothetical protein FWC70_10225 [Defluviitaleaceae bacterium]|nr:hypothetical protein [Defluviitaleaceae bacterium]